MLDFNLPEMSGIDVLQKMAQESINVPVVVMTAYGSELSAIEAFRLGAKDYVIKPFTTDEILEAIDRALVEKRLQHDNEALAEELRRVKAEMSRQSQEMQALFQIGKAITSLLSVDKILRRVLDAALYLTNAQDSAIWLPDPARSQFKMYRIQEHGTAEVDSEAVHVEELSLANAQAGKVLRTGQPLRESLFSGKGIQVKSGHYVRAVLHVPLKLRGMVMGVLSVSNPTLLRSFSRRDEFLLSFLADYSAIALENARVVQASDRALAMGLEELNTLIEITRMITASLDLDEIIRLTIQQVHDGWNVEAVSLWLLDERRQVLRVLANAGTPGDVLTDIAVPADEGIVGHVVQTGKWVYTNDVSTHPFHYRQVDEVTGFHTRSLLCVPLKFRDKGLGAMQLLNKMNGDFDDMDVERALAIATAVAIAITNARLFEEAEAHKRAHDDFVTTVSHDMRAPLNTISSFAAALGSVGPLNNEQELYVHHIFQATDRMMHLVNGLLDLARAKTAPGSDSHEPFNLCTVVQSVVDEWRAQALAKDVTVQLKTNGTRVCTVIGNAEQMRRAVSNLLDNAVKYSRAHQKVVVTVTRNKQHVLVAVRDWGIGIPVAELPHIFDKFYRGRSGSEQEGTGLGLALVQSVAQAHGGTVWAESDQGAGSTFVMRLPLAGHAYLPSKN